MSRMQLFPVHTDPSQWRHCGKRFLTASDAGTVLGLNPYKSPNVLMAEKLGIKPRDPAGPAVTWGKHHEGEALEALEDRLGVRIESPCGLYVRDSWLGAIPDGLAGEEEIVEIKSRWSAATRGKPMKPISDFDRAQVQIQLYCTGRERALFYQWAPRVQMLDVVEYDPQYIHDRLPALRKFYDAWHLGREFAA